MDYIEKKLVDIWPVWKMTEVIGVGSFGKVFRIERELDGEPEVSALKVLEIPQAINSDEVASLRSQGQTDKQIAEYFYEMVKDVVKEVKLMYKLQGISNIVSYQDHAIVEKEDEMGWFIFIRMEYLTKLNDILANEELRAEDGIKIGMDLCRALEICENNNIIHRDIKPANIFRSVQGDYKLGDFGIARQLEKTVAGMTSVGTIPYMAPEVYRGMPYNMSVDIYSLGILLYQLFNNMRSPFYPPITEPRRHSDEAKALSLRMGGAKMEPPCNAGKELSQIILKACAFDPKDRYSTANELYKELRRIKNQHGEEIIFEGVDRLNPKTGQVDNNKEDRVTVKIGNEIITNIIEESPELIGGDNSLSRIVTEKIFYENEDQGNELKKEANNSSEIKEESNTLFITISVALAVICILLISLVGMRFWNNYGYKSVISNVENTCTKDISGIIFQMQNKYGDEVMQDAKVYELSMGTYGYVIQTKNDDVDQYSFLLPRTDAGLKEIVLDEAGIYKKSLQSGVLYMMHGMKISAPTETEENERVEINNQSLILSKIILKGYPDVFDGCPSMAYILTDGDHKIRRIMLLTSDGFLVRADYTYDDSNRIIKEHWTSVWMYEEEWKKMGWFSQEENRMIVSENDIEKYIKDMIVLLPGDFVQNSPSGKNFENISTYTYNEQGFLEEMDYRNEAKTIEWFFSYENSSRTNALRKLTDESTGEKTEYEFVYERYNNRLIKRVSFDADFKTDNNIVDSNGDVSGFMYTYYDDGTMNMDVTYK